MAAASQTGQTVYTSGGAPLFRVRFSNLTSDQVETLSYNYASCPAQVPIYVDWCIANAGTLGRSTVAVECDYTTANATNKTVPIRFIVPQGADITGVTVDVYVSFLPNGTIAQTSP